MDWYLDILYFPNTNLSFPPNQVCTAVTVQRLPTARWLAGESFAPWTQSMRSWRDWLRNVARSLSLKNPCGSVFWAVHTLLLHQKRRHPIQPRWTVPSCTAAPRLTPRSAGMSEWKPVILCETFWGRAQIASWYNAEHTLNRDMCQEISTNWGSQTWQDFDQLCEYNPVETELINCLADVREPCQLGCKDLTYCTNFNNRLPPQLFLKSLNNIWTL